MTSPTIGVCSWSLQPENPDSLLASLDAMGIQAMQLAMGPLVDEPHVWEGSIDKLRARGVTILSGMLAFASEDYSTLQTIALTGGVRPDDSWEANLIHARAVTALASASSIDLVTFHAGFIPESDEAGERATILDRLRMIADVFADHEVALALETGQENAATLLEALAQLARPNVGINFDPANMILYGMGDPVEALRNVSPHIKQIHIKDAIASSVPGEWGSEVVVGEGGVDWPAFFEVVNGMKQPVNLIIERKAGVNRVDDIITARELIVQHLKP